MLSSTLGAVQYSPNSESGAEFMLSLFQKTNATVVDVFSQLEARSIEVPQASLDEYNQALLLRDEAASLLQSGNFSGANTKVVQALQKMKEALRIVYAGGYEQPSETEIALQRTIELKSALNRSYSQLHQLEALARYTANAGYNTTVLDAKIAVVQSLLDNATISLNQKNLEAASNSLADAKTLIARLTESFNTIAGELKIQRLATYITQTEARLSAIKENATQQQNTAALTAVNQAEASLSNAKAYLDKQLINQTLTELSNSKESEIQAVSYLTPSASVSSSDSATSGSAADVSPSVSAVRP
jgi:hypothetical protein